MTNNQTKLLMVLGTKRLFYLRNRKSEFSFNLKFLLSKRRIKGKIVLIPEAIIEVLFHKPRGFYEKENLSRFFTRLEDAKTSRGSLRCRVSLHDLKRFIVYADSLFDPPLSLDLRKGRRSKIKIWNRPFWKKYSKRYNYWKKSRHETMPKQMKRIEEENLKEHNQTQQ